MTSKITALTARARNLPKQPRITQTLSYYMSFVALGLIAASLGPALPALAEHTHTELSGISILFAAYSLGRLLGFIVSGQLFDRVPGHWVVALALLTASIMLALAPTMSFLGPLVLVVLILGSCAAALDTGCNTLTIWVHQNAVGPFISGLHFCFGLGALLSPIIITRLSSAQGGINWSYWAVSMLMFPAMLMVAVQPSPARPQGGSQSVTGKPSPLMVLLIALFLFLSIGAQFGFGWWIYAYTVALELGSASSAAYLNSLFWGSMALGRLCAAFLSVRFPPQAILWGSLLGYLSSIAVIMAAPESQAAMWMGTLGVGVTVGPLLPVMFSFAQRRMDITGRVASRFFIGVSLGTMSIPWLMGQVFERLGPLATMSTVMAAMIMATAVFASLTYVGRRHRSLA